MLSNSYQILSPFVFSSESSKQNCDKECRYAPCAEFRETFGYHIPVVAMLSKAKKNPAPLVAGFLLDN